MNHCPECELCGSTVDVTLSCGGAFSRLCKSCGKIVQKVVHKDREHLNRWFHSPAFLELLARLEHEQWSHWMKYQQTQQYEELKPQPAFHEEEWLRRMKLANTRYDALSETEKETDRVWARKVVELIKVI